MHVEANTSTMATSLRSRLAVILAFIVSGKYSRADNTVWADIFQSRANNLIWSDEFDTDGAPNPQFWTFDLGNGGWGNNELENYTQANAQVSNGQLIITAQTTNGAFTSARIKTLNKVIFQYGRLEGMLKLPNLGNGLWPAFWTLGHDFPVVGWPECGELDLMEMGSIGSINDGVVNRRVGSTAHWNNFGSYAMYGLYYDAVNNLDDGYFHNFTMDWTPDMITTYIDGTKIWAINITQAACPGCEEFHKPHFVLLNLAVGGTYTGMTTAQSITAPLPAEYAIDYVRVYSNEWTTVGGSHFVPPVNLTNCGCTQCTATILDQVAADSTGSYTCRERITWVLNNSGYSEAQACAVVSRQFPDVCGQGCNPYTCDGQTATVTDCGCGSACSASLHQIAAGSSCLDRMVWVMENFGSTEKDACVQVSGEYSTICGQYCNPYTCNAAASSTTSSTAPATSSTAPPTNTVSPPTSVSTIKPPSYLRQVGAPNAAPVAPAPAVPSTTGATTSTSTLTCGCGSWCTSATLDRIAEDSSGSFSCRARIEWVMQAEHANELSACLQVSTEFPNLCGQGCDPTNCERPPPAAVSNCGCPSTCTSAVLDSNATDSSGTYSCRARINWLMGNKGDSEQAACVELSAEFPSICGQGCNPNTC